MVPPAIANCIDDLERYKYAWDDTGPGPGNNYSICPLDKLVTEIQKDDAAALQYLVYHVAARSLPCWEIHCDIERPRYTINLMKECLDENKNTAYLSDVTEPTNPCVDDCRYSETIGASEAVALAAAFMLDCEPLTASSSIQGAYNAFDHIFTNDGFKQWFFEVAIPIAYEKRIMTEKELSALAVNDFTKSIYHSLFYPSERPAVAEKDKIDTPRVITRQQNKSWWKFW